MTRRELHPVVGWGLVTVQFLLLGLLMVLPRGSLWTVDVAAAVAGATAILLGLAMAAAAAARLGRSLTPTPVPRTDGELVTSGLYRFVRHPIYSALLLIGFGLAVIGASVPHLLAAAALIALLATKARLEEGMLLARFPDYAPYAARAGRFVPGLGRIRGPDTRA